MLIPLFNASEGSNAIGGAGAGRVATSNLRATMSSRRDRSLAAAVARSTVWILDNGVVESSSVLIKIGWEIPSFLALDCVGCLKRPKNDRFCLVCGSSPSQIGLDFWIDGTTGGGHDKVADSAIIVALFPKTPLSVCGSAAIPRKAVSADRV
jgi:hypothetical protein